jgi:methyl coenzyme M reductase subunit D
MKYMNHTSWLGYCDPVSGKEIEEDARRMIEANGKPVHLYLNLSDMLFELKDTKRPTALTTEYFKQIFVRSYSKTDFV